MCETKNGNSRVTTAVSIIAAEGQVLTPFLAIKVSEKS
jgi:hypothetical protein